MKYTTPASQFSIILCYTFECIVTVQLLFQILGEVGQIVLEMNDHKLCNLWY